MQWDPSTGKALSLDDVPPLPNVAISDVAMGDAFSSTFPKDQFWNSSKSNEKSVRLSEGDATQCL